MGSIPEHALADALAAQQQSGAGPLAVALALAVAGPESGFNAQAEGDYCGGTPSSFGYTQLHINVCGDGGGIGNGYTPDQLKDGVLNFTIAQRSIQHALDGGADPLSAIQPWSTRYTAIGLLPDIQAQLGGASLPDPGAIVATVGSTLQQRGPLGLPNWLWAGAGLLGLGWATDLL